MAKRTPRWQIVLLAVLIGGGLLSALLLGEAKSMLMNVVRDVGTDLAVEIGVFLAAAFLVLVLRSLHWPLKKT